jgi:hypothetical protein
MKTFKFSLSVAILAFVLTSCKNDTETISSIVDFENVALSSGISTGTSFTSGNCKFIGDPSQFWNGGIVCSSQNDTVTAGYLNEYSCAAGSGAMKSTKFGVLYSPGAFSCPADANGEYSIKSIMVANSTYAYLDMKNGNAPYSKKFVSGDWFKLTIKGFKSKVVTSGVDVYLADFRSGKTFLSKDWQKVNLSALGQVDSVGFSFSSSDNSSFGMNTPAYVCIDNIEFTQTVSTK